jgi:hypothetical protein
MKKYRQQSVITIGFVMAMFLLKCLDPRVLVSHPEEQKRLQNWLRSRSIEIIQEEPRTYRTDNHLILIFETRGVQGKVRGAIALRDQDIFDVSILKSNDGLTPKTLTSPDFLNRFRKKSTTEPILVDAITGATVSSRIVIDSINQRVRQWKNKFDQANDK